MPSVTQDSMPSALTPRTISTTASKSAPSRTSRQAAPMQKRDAPASRAILRLGEHVVDVHQRFLGEPGLLGVMGALRAIAAIFGAAAGLDRQQAGELHAVVLGAPMQALRLIDEIEQRRLQQRLDLGDTPVVPQAALEGDWGSSLGLHAASLAWITPASSPRRPSSDRRAPRRYVRPAPAPAAAKLRAPRR